MWAERIKRVLQAHFGETPAGPGHGDLNSDGTINVIDLSIHPSHWAPPPVIHADRCHESYTDPTSTVVSWSSLTSIPT